MFMTRMDQPRHDCSSGFLNPGCEARLVDELERDVATGDTGEIWIRGPGTMLGYYRAPELTREVLAGRWLAEDGRPRPSMQTVRSFVVGRLKELIKRSGFNVFPIEVEAVLNTHPAVKLVSGGGTRGERRRGRSHCVRRAAAAARWNEADLRSFVAARLASVQATRPSHL